VLLSYRRAQFAAVFASFLVVTSAHAQEANAAPSSVAPEPPTAPPTHADDGRLRFGFDLFAGAGFGGDAAGPVYGARIRFGWQVDRLAGVYLQGAVALWDSQPVNAPAGVTTPGVFAFQLTPLFSFTPSDLFEIAAGPSLDRLETNGQIASSLSTGSRIGADGVTYDSNYLGVHGKLAAHFGGPPREDTGRRVSFTIAGDFHATLAEGRALSFFTAGVGVDWY